MSESFGRVPEQCRLASVGRSFYLLAFAISWLIEIPQAAASRGLLHVQLPGIIAFLSPLAPMLAALIVSVGEQGIAEAGRLLGRLLWWRVGLRW